MADPVSGIDGPTSVGIGRYVDLTAKLASSKPGLKVKWTYKESKPGAKPQPLPAGPTLRYLAPSKLRGDTVEISARNGSTKAFDLTLTVDDVKETKPSKKVVCALDVGWKPEGSHHFAKLDGRAAFLVGRRHPYGTRRGLSLGIQDAHFVFRPKDYSAHAHWAELIACSTDCEGMSTFEALNTYDRASFTFGLIQFGAHQYRKNFHEYLVRAIAKFPVQAEHYFPELAVKGNDLFAVDSVSGKEVQLTSADDPYNIGLQQFIKPVSSKVTSSEVLFAARMLHWTRAESGMRDLMVDMAVERVKGDMKTFAAKLDGKSIAVCAAVFDIRLQGRGAEKSYSLISAALDSSKPLEALLLIFKKGSKEQERVKKLEKEIKARLGTSKLTYDKAAGDFK